MKKYKIEFEAITTKDEVVGNIIIHDGNFIKKFDLLAKDNVNKLKIYDKFVLFLYNIYKNIK